MASTDTFYSSQIFKGGFRFRDFSLQTTSIIQLSFTALWGNYWCFQKDSFVCLQSLFTLSELRPEVEAIWSEKQINYFNLFAILKTIVWLTITGTHEVQVDNVEYFLGKKWLEWKYIFFSLEDLCKYSIYFWIYRAYANKWKVPVIVRTAQWQNIISPSVTTLHIDIFIEKHWNYLRVHWPHSKSFYLYLTFEFELKLARVIFTYSCSFKSFVITRRSSSVTAPALSTSTFVHIQLFHEMPLSQEWLLATWHSERLHSGGAWRNVILPPDALMHCWESKSTHIHFASHMRVGMPKGCGKAFPPTFLCQRSELVGCAWKPCTVYECDALLYVCLPRLFPSTAQLLRGRALISHCQSNSPLLPKASPSGREKRFITLIHAPGEHLFELSCLERGFYQLSNIHLAGPQLCMKGWWRWGSAGRNDLVKLRSIGRRDEWVTNKRTEMGNRAILSSSLLPFRNGKIVTLQCTCFATKDLLLLGSKLIFFWDLLV